MATAARPAPAGPAMPSQGEKEILGKAYDLELLKRLWPFVRPHKRTLLLWSLFMPLTIVFELAQPKLFGYAIEHHILTGDIGMLVYDAAAYFMLVALQGGSSFCETWFLQAAGQRTMHALRIAAFDKVLSQRAAFFDRMPVGRLMTRMTNDIESLNDMFAQGAITLVADFIKMLAIVVVLFFIDWRLTLIALVTIPPLVLLVEYARRLMRASFRQIRVRLAAMNAFAQEHLSGIKVLALLGRARTALSEYNDINAGHRDAYLGQIRGDSMMYAIVEFIETIAIGTVLWFIAGRPHDSAAIHLVAVITMFIEYLRKFFTPVKDLSQKYAVLQGAMAASERIFELLDTDEPDGAMPMHTTLVDNEPDDVAPPSKNGPALELAGVQFSYGAEPVLRGVDLRVPRGASVAIVGATGSGKSTIIKLLTRLYERERGSIKIDGVDLRDLPLAELRRRITVVSQDVILFAGTLLENIAMGQEYARAQVEEAVRRVGLDRALVRRESGLDTPVAERGSNFSAGERQLVAFARALLRDPEILILDEATAHVDPEAELLIEKGVAELMKGRTTLVIAHRLTTIRNADLIVVMDKGQVIEQGNHDQLVAKGGFYAALERTFRRQEAEG
ncbi:MAG TPA: ABC transporter ATP-binding protein [Kofleriaceae bacterium]|jgi:ATP-binding cassette subfamily B protein